MVIGMVIVICAILACNVLKTRPDRLSIQSSPIHALEPFLDQAGTKPFKPQVDPVNRLNQAVC